MENLARVDRAVINLRETEPHLEHEGAVVTIEKITPFRAQELLRMNKKNRPMSKAAVKRYTQDMMLNHWMFTGDPIRISSENVILDGQHRLQAIAESERSQTLIIIRGLDPDIFSWLDLGKRRSGADALALINVPNYTTVASGIWNYFEYTSREDRKKLVRPQHYVSAVEHQPLWKLAGQQAVRLYNMSDRLIPAPHLCASFMLFVDYHIAQGSSEDDAINLVIEWLEGLAGGFNLSQTDSRWLVRKKYFKDKFETKMNVSNIYSLAYLVRAYNHYLAGTETKQIKIVTDTRGNIRRPVVGENVNGGN